MSDTTKIQWATSTGNPWIGCTKVSPGCKNCYAAELDAQRFSKTMGGGTKAAPVSHWGKGAPRFRTKGFWKDAVRWDRGYQQTLDELLCGTANTEEGVPVPPRPRIFPSLCDWLDDEVPIEWLADFLKLIHDTPNLDWLLLTKRPENWYSRLTEANYGLTRISQGAAHMAVKWLIGKEAPANIWLGVSVEDQQRADERIPALLKIPAKVRFLSFEPLLEAINFDFCACYKNISEEEMQAQVTLPTCLEQLDWVIVGGESGKGARPCNVEWIRSVVRQCKAAGVPCFVKQLGGFCVTDEASPDAWPAGTELSFSPCRADALVKLKDHKGGDPSEWPEDLRVRQFPNPRT